MTIKDDAAKTLTDYARPSVAVDTAVLTVLEGRLCVLVVASRESRSGWALPGTFLHSGERLAEAVLRSLRVKAGITGRTPKQLHVFDDPGRDPRGWVLSVAHVDVVPEEQLEPALCSDGVRLMPVCELALPGGHDGGLQLPFDHPAIVGKALEQVAQEYADKPDPAGLLAKPFTLRELRDLHDVVQRERQDRDRFRRKMEPILVPTGEMTGGGRGRPSRLWRRP